MQINAQSSSVTTQFKSSYFVIHFLFYAKTRCFDGSLNNRINVLQSLQAVLKITRKNLSNELTLKRKNSDSTAI